MEEWNVVLPGVVPDVLRGPLGKRADLADGPGSGQRKVFGWLQCSTTLSLFATEAGEPEFVAIEGGEKRFDLPQTTTATGIGLVENAKLRLLLRHSEFGHKVDEVHRPGLRHAVAIFVDLSEVVAGVEEDNGNIAQNVPDKVKHDHVLGLEAVGDADIALCLFQLLPN